MVSIELHITSFQGVAFLNNEIFRFCESYKTDVFG